MNEDEPIPPNAREEQAFRLAYLVAGFIQHTLTEAEDDELDDWVNASMNNQLLFERLLDEKNQERWQEHIRNTDTQAALQRVKSRLNFDTVKKRGPIKNLWRYAAAAAVITALAVYFYPRQSTQSPKPMSALPSNDIAPPQAVATLTLSDGTVIGLDTIKNGRVMPQQYSNITKTGNGELMYQSVAPTLLPQADIFNTLTVPVGGQYRIVLPDGTKVWLNASSSIKYPTVFGGAKRKVELEGEGYFEVAKDPMYPFEVVANGTSVQVLGTHFNVNAYRDEPVVSVALAEGSVKINNSVLLKPGEEGRVVRNGNIEKGNADLPATLAWKDGKFFFREMPIEPLMRQIARWYNAGIIYDVKPSEHFNASIPRGVPVSKLLHLLEETGAVHFKIHDRTITVLK